MNDGSRPVDPAVGDTPQSLLLAMEQLISGERSVAEFRDELINLLYEQPPVASATRSLVDDYAARGLIPEQIHRLLSRDIDKATNEEQPTTPTELGPFGDGTDAFESSLTQAAEAIEDTRSRSPSAAVAPAKRRTVEVGSMLRDRFEIVGRAPGGSMGVVFKAIDHRLAEAEGGTPFVAIKVLAPDYASHGAAMRALQQEAAKGRYLSHPNIVRFLDLDRCDGNIFLVMEWLEGRPLSALLNERPGEPLPMSVALDILQAVGEALEHAHRVGVTHADVKPGNIMLLPGGGVKLLDFGIARARGDAMGRAMVFDNSFLQAATPAYASPAVLSGEAARPIDDVFSFACVAYRLLSGRRVFRDKTALEAREEGLVAERIEGVGGRRWRAIERALALDETDRTASMTSLLDGLGVGDSVTASHTSRWPWLALAAVVLLTATAVLTSRWPGDAGIGEPPAGQRAVSAPPSPAQRAAEAPPPAPSSGVDDPRGRSAPPLEATVTSAVKTLRVAENPASLTLALPASDAVVPALFAELVVNESDDDVYVRLTRRDTSVRQALQLGLAPPSEAMGIALRDRFSVSPMQPVFEPGQASVDLRVRHEPDDWLEPDVTVRLTLSTDDGAVVARVDLLLRDDDLAELNGALPEDIVGFTRPQLRLREDELAAAVALWRLNPGAESLRVAVSLEAGSASPDEDFVTPPRDTVLFAAGAQAAVVYVPVVLDNEREPEETLMLTLDGRAALPGLHRTIELRISDATVLVDDTSNIAADDVVLEEGANEQ